MKDSLRPLPHDDRDFQVGALFLMPKLAELPADFVLEGYNIKHQRDTDFCSAFASTGMSELQEGVILSPEYSFAMGKKISGDVEAWGQDLRGACKPHVKIGDIEQADVPYGNNVTEKERNYLANPANWPEELTAKAAKHKKASYLKVTGVGDDAFDTIRKTIWKWRDEKRAVLIGVQWSWAQNQYILDTIGQGTGHAMYCIGWKTIGKDTYLIIVNSLGEETGNKGTHLMSREVINYYEPIYGAFMFVDMPREDLQYYVDNKIKVNENWVSQIVKSIWQLVISPFITPKEKIQIIKDTTDALNEISNKIMPKTPTDDDLVPINDKSVLLDKMCEAIKFREGWFEGSNSFRCNNPGNLKYAGQYGSTGPNARGFAVFPTYQAGYDALKRQILLVANGKSRAFPKDCTLSEFFAIYAPSNDGNDPLDYAKQVAGKMGVDIYWKLTNLA